MIVPKSIQESFSSTNFDTGSTVHQIYFITGDGNHEVGLHVSNTFEGAKAYMGDALKIITETVQGDFMTLMVGEFIIRESVVEE